jgi:hypothetical protein
MRGIIGKNAMSIALRFVSLILIIVALVLLGADVVASLEKGGQITVHSIAQVWAALGKSSAESFKAWLAHTLPAPVPAWVDAVMALPAWALTGVLGVVLAFLFGRHTPEQA